MTNWIECRIGLNAEFRNVELDRMTNFRIYILLGEIRYGIDLSLRLGGIEFTLYLYNRIPLSLRLRGTYPLNNGTIKNYLSENLYI